MLALLAMLAIASLAVDYGRIALTSTELSGAVDAAGRAAAAGLDTSPAEARVQAKSVASKNTVNGRPLTLLDSDIEIGTWSTATNTFTVLTGAGESAGNAVRVTGRLAAARGTAVDTVFLPAIGGRRQVDLTKQSVSQTAVVTPADVVVVQDVSGSFSAEIADAKTGMQGLVNYYNTSTSNSRVGLVAFTGTATTESSLKLVYGNYTSLTSAVSGYSVGGWGMPSTGSGTDIAAGIEQAQAVFDASPSTRTKLMIIVSDGSPSASYSGKHSWMNDAQLLAQAQADADAAWADGIHVSVVYMDATASATDLANLSSLVRGGGKVVRVTSSTSLTSAVISAAMKATTMVQ